MTANSSSRSIGLRIAPCTFSATRLFFHSAVGAQQHDREVCERRIVLLGHPELRAAHPRHHEIQQDEPGTRAVAQNLQRLLAVGGRFDLVPPIAQRFHQRLANVEVVFDEQDGEWGHARIVLEQPGVIRFCCSNRLEALVEALADTVGAGRTSLFDPVTLVVPNTLVEGYVKQGLARRLGIAAQRRNRIPARLLAQGGGRQRARTTVIADRDLIEGALLELFHDLGWLSGPELGPVRDYLVAAAARRRRAAIASGSSWRPSWRRCSTSTPSRAPRCWPPGGRGRWFPRPIRRCSAGSARSGWRCTVRVGCSRAAGMVTLPEFFAQTPAEKLRPPRAVHLFGISYVARLYGSIFETLARATDLYVYTLSPNRVAAPARRGRRPAPDDSPPRVAWARPGRDNVQLLTRLAGGERRRALRRPAVRRARAAAGGASGGGARAAGRSPRRPRAPTTTA